MNHLRLLSALMLLGALPLGALAACSTVVATEDIAPFPATARLVGNGCAVDAQCASKRCSAEVASGSCGICLEVQKLGESCTGPQQGCSASATCSDGVCTSTKKVLGEACQLGAKGDDRQECDDELFCRQDEDYDYEPECAAPVPLGGSCAWWSSRCVAGAQCSDDGVCELPKADSCWDHPCAAGKYCAADQTCKSAVLAAGAPCGVVDGSWVDGECGAGTVCGSLTPPGSKGEVSGCVSLPVAGELCVRGRCAEGSFCSEQTTDSSGVVPQRCDPLRGLGEACSTSYVFHKDCAAGLDCRNEICQTACR